MSPQSTPSSSATPSLEEIVQQLKSAGVDTEALQRSFAAGVAATGHLQSAPEPGLVLNELTFAAATRGAFLPRDLMEAGRSGDPLSMDRLLAACDPMTAGTQKAWQLREPLRRQILLEARSAGRLDSATDDPGLLEARDERDAEGPLLRRALAGQAADPQNMGMEELTRFATVSRWLDGTGLAKIPSPQELDRLIGQREILDPFRTLVGRSLEAGHDGSGDRVVGRVDEMEQLRSYVGVLKPEELRFYATRAARSIWSTLTRSDSSEPLLIQGIGGMGKSTLIGKFVLDHALFPGVPLPFVYLDFDRAALAPRQPLQLLIEITVQLGQRFPEMEERLRLLRTNLREVIDSQAKNQNRSNREMVTSSELHSFCQDLQRIVEDTNRAQAPVLMVFDTFEVVQYDQLAVHGVTSLIAGLRGVGNLPWKNLRIVVAGRGELEDIETTQEPVRLKRLSKAATEQLLRRRSETESLGLEPSQVTALAPVLRNSPLDVMVVTRWLKDRPQEDRPTLLAELVEGLEGAVDAERTEDGRKAELAALRVTGILTKRMIDHIKDADVRDLVFPGLVVRAVTPYAIREVMAPASGLSTAERPLAKGAEDELFRRLELERWLVERRGAVLRHRPEVRQAMLALMRSRDAGAFEATNQLALDCFMARASQDTDARAEAVYHLLLRGGGSLEEADRWWSPQLGATLASAVDDLPPLEQAYLKAKLGRRVPAKTLASFPPAVLQPLLESFGLSWLRTVGPEPVLRLVRAADAQESAAFDGLRSEACYRAGRWRELTEFARGDDSTAQRLQLRCATRDAGMQPLHGPSDPEGFLARPALRWDFITYAVCAEKRYEEVSSMGAQAMEHAQAFCRTSAALPAAAAGSDALRILAFFDRAPDSPILRRVDFDNHFATVSGREVQAFVALVQDRLAPDRLTPEPSEQEMQQLNTARVLVLELRERHINSVIADRELTRRFAASMRELSGWGERTAGGILPVLALKHPDWLQPLGHALTRAFAGKVPIKTGWWSSIEQYLGNTGKQRRAAASADGFNILALADEASCLHEAVGEYLRLLMDGKATAASSDFRHLAQAFSSWTRLLQSAAGRN